MNYSKPEVAVLGDAAAVIQLGGKFDVFPDGGIDDATSSYDLDE